MCLILSLVFGVSCKGSTTPETPPVKNPPTIENFTANPTTIHRGDSSTLSWSVKNATTVTIDQGVGTVSSTTGTKSVNPTATTTYTLTATNSDGTKTATCVVTIELVLPTIDYFLSNPTSVRRDDPSTLTWSVQNATTITIDQGVGTVSATGSWQVTPQVTTTYTLTATNNDGQKTATCQVEIKKWAILSMVTSPTTPILIYSAGTNTTYTNFNTILTESNGVGGLVDSVLVGTFIDENTILGAWDFGGGIFNAFGTFTKFCELTSPGRPNLMLLYSEGTDSNGYYFELATMFTISWASPESATAQFLRVIEPKSNDRMIRSLKEHQRIKR